MSMKKSLLYFLVALGVSLLIGLLANGNGRVYDFFTISGLANLLISILLLLASIICFIAKKKELGKELLTATGLLLLCGTITCSFFPFQLNH